ncbi:ROK family transcriptional regulator [Devosia sp. XK-2]|uniref:ROK family transcriptional regulator n=1 Tax=Devosia sp. XK-2 TaxID=3126689 RepID=UPI0030D2F2C4
MLSGREPTGNVFESGRRGVRHAGVRHTNKKTVLTVVAFNAGASNAEISRLTGLAPQTVSAILVDLEQEGLIVRGPVLRGRRGQPATPILLNQNGGFAIGIEIGWRHLDIVLIDMHVQVLRHHHESHDYPDAETLFDRIGAIIDQFSATLTPEQRLRLLDVGIAMPGSLAADLDLIGAPPAQVAAWRQLDIMAELAKRTCLNPVLINDGNAGCWAELIALEAPRPANVIVLLVSHLLLAGIVGDGALWEGSTGHAVDLGSTLVSVGPEGPQLVHQIASLFALRARLAAAGHPSADQPIESWDLEAMAEPIESWLGDAAKALAQMVHNTSMIVEHPLIVLDTALDGTISARLLARLEAEMACLATRGFVMPRVIGGRLGRLAPAIGAAEMPLYRRYF